MESRSQKSIAIVIKKYDFELDDLKNVHQQAEVLLQQLQDKYSQTKAVIEDMENQLRQQASANNMLSITDMSLRQNYIRFQKQHAIQDKELRDKAQECKNVALENVIAKRFDIRALEKILARRRSQLHYEQARINQKEVDELWSLRRQ